MIRTVAKRGARAVHGGVPATDHHHVAANAERITKVGGLHKVNAVDEPLKVAPWHIECNRIHGASTDGDRIEVVLELLECHVPADLRVVDEFHAELLNEAHVGLNRLAWEAEGGDADQHGAAAVREAVIDGDLVALDGEFTRNGEASRSGANHGHTLGARRDLRCNVRDARGGVPLHQEALHGADCKRAINVAAATGALAWSGADVGAHCGDRIRIAGEKVTLFEAPFGGEIQVAAAVGANGAGLLALNVTLKPRSIDRLNQKVLRLEGHNQPFLPTTRPLCSRSIVAGAPRGRLRRKPAARLRFRAGLASLCRDLGEHFRRMAGGGDTPPDTRNVAARVDQERDTVRPSEGPLANRPLPPDAVRLSNAVIEVGEDREVERELVAKGGLALLIIWTHAPDDGARVLAPANAQAIAFKTRLFQNYSEQIPGNENGIKASESLNEIAQGLTDAYRKGTPSPVFCKLKYGSIENAAYVIQHVVGNRPR